MQWKLTEMILVRQTAYKIEDRCMQFKERLQNLIELLFPDFFLK